MRARSLTRPTSWRVMRLSSCSSSSVGCLTYIIVGHLHFQNTTAEVPGTFCYLLTYASYETHRVRDAARLAISFPMQGTGDPRGLCFVLYDKAQSSKIHQ